MSVSGGEDGMATKSLSLPKMRFGRKGTGITLVLTGAILWGVSGTVAQYLFQEKGFHAGWLVAVRMLISGLVLLTISSMKEKQSIWKVWQEKKSRRQLLVFGIFGMIGVQYTYFAAVEAGNAATSTLLQYLGPVLIMAYLAVKFRKMPTAAEFFAAFLALLGIFLLVTKGRMDTIAINPLELFWGLLSAGGAAVYSVQPVRLLKQWGSAIVVGWGMLIGGVVMSIICPPWTFSGDISFISMAAVAFVILFGTLAAFYLYMESLKYLKATESSLLGCAEPLSAAILSVVWMGVPFTIIDWLGAGCILATIIILSKSQSPQV